MYESDVDVIYKQMQVRFWSRTRTADYYVMDIKSVYWIF